MAASRAPVPVGRPAGRLPRAGEARAFTLVELLVVMSIISMLVGLLLPALGEARRASRASACASNQHQIALAVTQFAGDHFDLLPREGISPWHERPRVGANIPWIEATRPYLVAGADKNDLRSPVYLDPAHPNPNHPVHYVVNGIAFEQGAGRHIGGEGDRRAASFSSRLHRAADTIYLTAFTDDRDNSIALNVGVWNLKLAAGVYDVWLGIHIWGPDTGSNWNATNVRRVGYGRHGSTNNVLFADMHVGKLKTPAIQDQANWFDGEPKRSP